MNLFIDSANLSDIEEGLKRGFAKGITTNPSLLSKEPKSSFASHVGKIIELINRYQPGIHLSVEVFSRDTREILRQAEQFLEQFGYPQMSLKVQVGWEELEAIKTLSSRGFSVNCTTCMTVTQAMMAAHAGAKYVSLFWGRIRDGGTDPDMETPRRGALDRKALDQNDFDPSMVVRHTRDLLDQSGLQCDIIAGSIRSVVDIRDAALAGAHIVTVPPKFFPDMMHHFKTDQVVNQFMTDWQQWIV